MKYLVPYMHLWHVHAPYMHAYTHMLCGSVTVWMMYKTGTGQKILLDLLTYMIYPLARNSQPRTGRARRTESDEPNFIPDSQLQVSGKNTSHMYMSQSGANRLVSGVPHLPSASNRVGTVPSRPRSHPISRVRRKIPTDEIIRLPSTKYAYGFLVPSRRADQHAARSSLDGKPNRSQTPALLWKSTSC